MANSSAAPSPRRDSYLHQTHRPWVCLVFIAPLLLLFHVGTAHYGSNLLAPHDVGRLLRYFGATAAYLPALLIVTVLMVHHVLKRDPWELRPIVLVGMVVESVAWTIPLMVMSLVAHKVMPQAATTSAASQAFQDILVAVGAGIYEEFIFRLALISLAMLVFVDILRLPKSAVVTGAVLVGACLFSLYHFPGGLPEGQFPWAKLIFRVVAGTYLGGIFVARGFAVAVGTHACFNLFVVLGPW